MSTLHPDATPTASDAPARPRHLIVLDVDSTLIRDEVIELLAAEAGVGAQVAEVTERAMRGELDFAASLRDRVALLAGLPVEVFAAVGGRIRVTDGAESLIAAAHEAGDTVGVVSGGFAELVGPLAERLGLDHWAANRLRVAAGRLTGEIDGAVVDAETKARLLRSWAAEDVVAAPDTVAIGDGANDLRMMAAAGTSVAFCAKPVVREAADHRIDAPDLALVLPLIGLG